MSDETRAAEDPQSHAMVDIDDGAAVRRWTEALLRRPRSSAHRRRGALGTRRRQRRLTSHAASRSRARYRRNRTRRPLA